MTRGGVKKFQRTRVGKRIAPEEKCGTGKVCSYCFAIIVLLASCIGLVVATGNADTLQTFVENNIPDFNIANLNDPFAGGQTAGVWPVDQKNGLSIEILNAVDESWDTVFSLAEIDWNFGSPDALSLTVTKIPYELACDPVSGKVKVCNGDYGETDWRGICLCTIGKDGAFTDCAAKMNDLYLPSGNQDLRQYTMCHEMGHGFGLPHSDENFDNPDLGNCMDYTENFNVNKRPDESQYMKLAEFYGEVPPQRTLLRNGYAGEGKKQETNVVVADLPDSVVKRRKEAMGHLHEIKSKDLHKHGWRMLHQTTHGEEHIYDLGEGYKLAAHMLRA